jgi:alkylated DNA repair protein (DNA oxidative demethylase)
MVDLLEPVEAAAAQSSLAPGLTLFQRYLDEPAQQALAGEIAELVVQVPWFVPRMPRSGRPFSVKMTNCGSLGWVSGRGGGYRYQATHPITGNAWPAIPLSVLNIWRALASLSAFARGLPSQFLRFFGADGPAPGPRRG